LTCALPLRAAEPITRERILATAAAFAEHLWTCSLDNQFGGTVCEPTWVCDWEADTTYVGLPYDWGGYVSIEQFDQDLADGLGAGSHDDWEPLDCTTGVDCSGYVSQCWEVSHQNTYSMDNVAHAIAADDLLPGDAWNKPHSHIVLWVRQAENGAPVFYEATGRPVSKVRLNEEATWSYLEGYSPIRLDKLEAPAPLTVGTLENPIEIEAFPFESNHNTALSSSRLWNTYACAPDTDESGPEIYYRFTVSGAGTLTATVEDPTGVDVDLHLLSAADPQACLARNDTTFTVGLEAGTYWLVVDTWVNAAGTELPGSYHLEVTFDRAADPDVVDDVAPDAGPSTPDAQQPGDDTTDAGLDGGGDPDAEEGGGGGGCLWIPNSSVGYGETVVVFALVLGLGLIVRLVRRRKVP